MFQCYQNAFMNVLKWSFLETHLLGRLYFKQNSLEEKLYLRIQKGFLKKSQSCCCRREVSCRLFWRGSTAPPSWSQGLCAVVCLVCSSKAFGFGSELVVLPPAPENVGKQDTLLLDASAARLFTGVIFAFCIHLGHNFESWQIIFMHVKWSDWLCHRTWQCTRDWPEFWVSSGVTQS